MTKAGWNNSCVNKWGYVFFLSLACSFFASYVVIRGLVLGLTYDECTSIHLVAFFDPGRFFCNSNTHLVNSCYIALVRSLGWTFPFMYRALNIGAFAVYAVSLYGIIGFFHRRWMRLVCFLGVLANPYTIEFFSLARGYGISLTLLSVSLFFVLYTVGISQKKRFFLCANLCAFLALLSNYSFFYFYCATTAVLLLAMVSKRRGFRSYTRADMIRFLLLNGLGVGVVLFHSFLLYTKGELYYGAPGNFFSTFISSGFPWGCLAPERFSLIDTLLPWAGVFLIVYFLVALRTARGTRRLGLFLGCIAVGSCIIPYILQRTCGVLYPVMRTSLWVWPLSLCFLFAVLKTRGVRRYRVRAGVLCLISLLLVSFFLMRMNFSYCTEWRYAADTQDALQDLVLQTTRGETLFVSFALYQPVWYYNTYVYNNWFQIAQYEKPWEYNYVREDLPGKWYHLPEGRFRPLVPESVAEIFRRPGWYYVPFDARLYRLPGTPDRWRVVRWFPVSGCSLVYVPKQ